MTRGCIVSCLVTGINKAPSSGGWMLGEWFLYALTFILGETKWIGWLVVWLPSIWHFPRNIGNFIIPIDELIFFRGVAQPPTSNHMIFRIKKNNPFVRFFMMKSCDKPWIPWGYRWGWSLKMARYSMISWIGWKTRDFSAHRFGWGWTRLRIMGMGDRMMRKSPFSLGLSCSGLSHTRWGPQDSQVALFQWLYGRYNYS